jgi:Uncharacterized protein conserved in bacteria (DUF2191).
MRTNIVIDDELVAEVMRVTHARSKREAVDLGAAPRPRPRCSTRAMPASRR